MNPIEQQIQASLAGSFAKFGKEAEITTIDEEFLSVVVIRGEPSQFVMIDPGQGSVETFKIRKSEYSQPRPNDKIVFDKEEEWIVQPGFTLNFIPGVWSIPVVSSRRIKA